MTAAEAIRALREIKAAQTDPEHTTEVLRKFLTDRMNKAAEHIKERINNED